MEMNPQADALKWLLEMEMIQDPNVLNGLILNIHRISDVVTNVEFVTDLNNKRLLVFLEFKIFNFWGKKKKITYIMEAIENLLDDALPSFNTRITTDRALLERAIKIVGNT